MDQREFPLRSVPIQSRKNVEPSTITIEPQTVAVSAPFLGFTFGADSPALVVALLSGADLRRSVAG